MDVKIWFKFDVRKLRCHFNIVGRLLVSKKDKREELKKAYYIVF